MTNLSQNLDSRYLARITSLIAEGEKILDEMECYEEEIVDPYYGQPCTYIADNRALTKWAAKCISFLETIGNTYRVPDRLLGLFNRLSIDDRELLEDIVSELEAFQDNLETGFLQTVEITTAINRADGSTSTSIGGSLNIQEIGNLLSRVNAGLHRWTWEKRRRTGRGQPRKWFIDNEYHVQNLLYFLLVPVFADLRYEEYTPAVSSIGSRADLALPSLNLIIEVKFMRRGENPQHIIRQISEDAGLYLAEGSNYDKIIAFIWDDSQRTQDHEVLVNDLKRLPGVVDAIVIPRPGDWEAEPEGE